MKFFILILCTLVLFSSCVFAMPTIQKNTLCWTPPITNADGSPLINLKSFKIYWNKVTGSYIDGDSKDVGNVTCTDIKTNAGQLTGTYYFVVTAVNIPGIESGFSNEVSAPFFIPMSVPANLNFK